MTERNPAMWGVEVVMEFHMVVIADSEKEAADVARSMAHTEVSNCGHDFDVAWSPELIDELIELPEGWDDEAIPYLPTGMTAPNGVETCAQWLDWIEGRPASEVELEAHGQLNALATPNGDPTND